MTKSGVQAKRVREWVQLVLGAVCIVQQLTAVSLGRSPELIVWSGGVALLGAGLLSFADLGHRDAEKDDET